MIRRLFAARATWTRGWLLPHLARSLREPKEPPRGGPNPDLGAATVLLPAVLDARPGHRPPADVPHVGAQDDEDTSAFYAALKADDTETLDPDERAWEEAFARLEGLLDLEARRGERRLNARLDLFAPGWDSQVCDPAFVGRSHCGRCVPDFDAAMELAGVIALPAEPVDWATGEWPVLEVTG